MGTESVRIANAVKRFGSTTALDHVDLTVASGEFLAILGRSGSGKSTLLRILAGLERLTSGTVSWPAGGCRPRTGMVFQQPLLIPWLTVSENVSFATRFSAHRENFNESQAADLMVRFGVDVLADRYPDQLSGGQAQRVAILRAVATAPRLLLLDEPFSALDPAIRADLQQWLAEVAAALDVTVVLVTHDVDEALTLANRVVQLDRTGRLSGEWELNGAAQDRKAEIRRMILEQYSTLADEAAV